MPGATGLRHELLVSSAESISRKWILILEAREESILRAVLRCGWADKAKDLACTLWS